MLAELEQLLSTLTRLLWEMEALLTIFCDRQHCYKFCLLGLYLSQNHSRQVTTIEFNAIIEYIYSNVRF